MRLKKSERRGALLKYLAENPFAIDEQLAEHFGVSVATIRLDRAALQIPEARARILRLASSRQDPVRALDEDEVFGEIVDLKLDRYAVSRLEILPSHVFARTGIVRGHHLFAQVNSLAVAVMDADIAVTAKSDLKFHRSVKLGETLIARVDVVARRAGVAKCDVSSQSADEIVLDGTIWVSCVEGDEHEVFTGGERT